MNLLFSMALVLFTLAPALPEKAFTDVLLCASSASRCLSGEFFLENVHHRVTENTKVPQRSGHRLTFRAKTLAPHNHDLPAAFYKLPDEARAKATVVFTGTFGRGRGPCIFMPDGSRRWALLSWFHIQKVHRGQVGGKFIHKRTTAPKEEVLKDGHEYLVLLRPNEESMKAIKAGDVPARDALEDEEIISIVELTTDNAN